jgi:hypothetical protein
MITDGAAPLLVRSSDALIRHFSNATLTDIAAAFNEVNCSVQLEVAPDVGGTSSQRGSGPL